MPIPSGRTTQERWATVALLGITLVVAAWRLTTLAAEDLWFDEVFTAVLASQDLGTLLARAVADQTNPPGFYLLLWAWARLGSFDTAWLRSLPALAAVATIPALAWTGRVTGMRLGAALVAALVVASSPLLLEMGVELRAYAPLALASTLVLGLAARVALRDAAPTRAFLVALALAQVAMVSLHYFGALVSAAALIGTWWVARPRLRAALGAAAPALLLLAGWLAVVISRSDGRVGTNADWIGTPSIISLVSLSTQVLGTFGTSWGAWLSLLALVSAVAMTAREAQRAGSAEDRARARWFLTIALLPVIAVPIGGLVLGRPLWVARYLIIVLPPLALLLADRVTRADRRVRVLSVAALVSWCVASAPVSESDRRVKPAWSLVARALTAGGPATVCTNESFVALPLRYYAIAEEVPLTVLDLGACAVARDATLMLTRPGTEASLDVLRASGLRLGEPRDLGTALPRVEARRIVR